MNKKPLLQERYSQRVDLYRLVFSGRLSFVVLILLFTSFFLQPFYRVAANTDGAVPLEADSVAEASVVELEALDIDILGISPSVQPGLPLPETQPDNEAATLVPEDSSTLTTHPKTSVEEGTPKGGQDTVDEVTENEDSKVEEGDQVPPLESSNDSLSTSALATTSELGVSTTSELAPESLPLVHESYGENEVTFNKDSCVLVDGGAYYCQKNPTVGSVGDSIISEPDSGGDLEIFVVKDGDYHQITHNFVDDAAPFYDARSKTMVWHRLVSDRYVIVSYDFETQAETLITDGTFNDMEPSRYGDYTVWQRWSDGFWQIMLADDTDIKQLTTVANHHVAPQIRDDLILWHTSDASGKKQLQTFDLKTSRIHTIDDSEGAAMSNPRMMMVYEAVYDNGDIVTRGVDLKTGRITALGVLPSSLPTDLPESESTGETRALIQNKSQENDQDVVNDEPEPEPLPALASSTDGLTIDLRTDTPSTTSELIETTSETQFDLFIPKASSTHNILEE